MFKIPHSTWTPSGVISHTVQEYAELVNDNLASSFPVSESCVNRPRETPIMSTSLAMPYALNARGDAASTCATPSVGVWSGKSANTSLTKLSAPMD